MVKLRFPNGYTGKYKDQVAEILVKKGRATVAKDEAEAPSRKPLERMKIEELRAMAQEKGLEGVDGLTRAELIELLKG